MKIMVPTIHYIKLKHKIAPRYTSSTKKHYRLVDNKRKKKSKIALKVENQLSLGNIS